MTAFTLRLTEEKHKEFKIQLIKDGLTIQEWFNQQLEEYLKDDKDANN